MGEKLSKIVILLLDFTSRVLGPIVTDMKTQSLVLCTFILKENAYKILMVRFATGQLEALTFQK